MMKKFKTLFTTLRKTSILHEIYVQDSHGVNLNMKVIMNMKLIMNLIMNRFEFNEQQNNQYRFKFNEQQNNQDRFKFNNSQDLNQKFKVDQDLLLLKKRDPQF